VWLQGLWSWPWRRWVVKMGREVRSAWHQNSHTFYYVNTFRAIQIHHGGLCRLMDNGEWKLCWGLSLHMYQEKRQVAFWRYFFSCKVLKLCIIGISYLLLPCEETHSLGNDTNWHRLTSYRKTLRPQSHPGSFLALLLWPVQPQARYLRLSELQFLHL
jgi:hypothetical protein